MPVASAPENPLEFEGAAIAVAHYGNGEQTPWLAKLDEGLCGAISELRAAGEFKGAPGELVTLFHPKGKTKRILLFGLGERDGMTATRAFQACAAAGKELAGKDRPRVAFYVDPMWTPALQTSGLAGALVGSVGQDLYRKERKRFPFAELAWAGGSEATLQRGRALAEGMNLTRRLVNEPPDRIYPEAFADRVVEAGKEAGFKVEVWDEKRLAKERCGSLLGVGQGSDKPSRLVILEYRGRGDGPWDVTLVGKGVTFDSGGYSIKPTDGMKTMKCDMAGGAAVVGAMHAIASEKLPVNVIGLVGLVENLISGSAFKLGDVLTARSGKTIEIHNTDAEGRLVLADVLDVAIERGAQRIVDLATLTGACVVALGTDIAGAMTNDEAWYAEVKAAADAAGEWVWPLPMFKEFGDQIRSEVADIKNVGEGRWGGAITAAKFLEEFVQGKPWVHLDIAGPAFLDAPKPWLDAGATGSMVRTLFQLAEKLGTTNPA